MDVVLLSICKGLIGKSLMGISSIKLNADETKFIITCKDGSEFTVNVPKGAGFTTDDVKSTLDVGAIKNGDIVKAGSNLQSFVEQLLIQDEAPAVVLQLDISDGDSYDVVREKGIPVNITAKSIVTKKSYDISKVEWTSGIIATESSVPTVGSTFTRSLTNVSNTTAITCKATDVEALVGSATKTITFVNPMYCSLVNASVDTTNITESDIINGAKILKTKGAFDYTVTANAEKIVFAIPRSYGNLASIKDVKNGFELRSGYETVDININTADGNSTPYTVYIPVLESTVTNFGLKLSW